MYQEYMDIVKSKTNYELGVELIHSFSESLNLPLMSIFNDSSLSYEQKKKKLVMEITGKIFEDIDTYEFATTGKCDVEESLKIYNYYAENGTFLVGDEEIEEPNLYYTKRNTDAISNYKDEQITSFVYGLAKRFENIGKAKEAKDIAVGMMMSGILGIGARFFTYYIQSLIIGFGPLESIVLSIKSVGLKTVIALIAIVIVGAFLWLFMGNEKKILGIIINDTDHDLVVKNWRDGITTDHRNSSHLYMNHGEMLLFPSDAIHGDFSKPKIQINKRYYINKNGSDNPDNVYVSVGVFHAQKCFGLFGTEGVMILSSTRDSNYNIALQFAVPYVMRNGTNMRFVKNNVNIKDLHSDMYENRKKSIHEVKDNTILLKSNISSENGGQIGLISTIIDTKKL